VESLLALLQREDEDQEFDLLEMLNGVGEDSWRGVLLEANEILKDLGQRELWYRTAAVCYWGVSRVAELPFEKMELVARLYRCLVQYPGFGGEGLSDGENLVWSIAIDLKGVGYESDWDPMKDPEVMKHFSAMANT